MVLIEKTSNMAKSGGTCFPKVCLLSYNKIGQSKPSRTCIIFDLKLWKIILIIFRPFWPEVSRLSFVSVSLLLDVSKIATIYRNYSLASGILRNILKACWLRCAFGRSSRTKQQICQCLNSVDSAVSGRFVEFSSVYALRWNKVIDCRDHTGWVGCLCKWLMVLVDLLTGCSRQLLLHEHNVHLLISFV